MVDLSLSRTIADVWTGRVRRAAIAASAYALGGGVVSLLGWVAGVPRLTDWASLGISIQPNTAVASACSGLAVILLAKGRPRAASWLAAVVFLIGASTLFQWMTGINLDGLNTLLLFGREFGRGGVLHPGRMGPPGAVCWTLLGAAMLLAARPPAAAGRRAAAPIALATTAIGILSIVGYAYGVSTLYTLPYATVIALQTATFILAVSLAVIGILPDQPPATWFVDGGATGAVARRALPFALIVPPLIGWVRLKGEQAGYYDTRFGVAITTLVLITLLLSLLAWSLATISRHEAAAHRSELRRTRTLETLTDGFVTLDAEWRFEFVNPEATRLLGRSARDLIGRDAWAVFPESIRGNAHQALMRAVESGEPAQFEDYNRVLGRWFAGKAYPNPEGGLSVFFQDITTNRLQEQQIEADRRATERLHGVATRLVSSGDMRDLLREILAAATEFTGAEKGNIRIMDPATGDLRIAVHQGHGPAFVEHFATSWCTAACEAAARGGRVLVTDVREDPALRGTLDLGVLLADGVRAIESTPLTSRDGRLLGVLSVHFSQPHEPGERQTRYVDLLARMAADFIERTQVEQDLRDADRRKDAFLATLAHELRGPLAPLSNSLELLDHVACDPARAAAARGTMRRHLAHMVRLIDDLLDVSRITRDKLLLRREPVRLSAILAQAAESVQPTMRAREQVMDVRLPHEPVTLDADPARLVQVFSNLLSNASNYTPPHGRIRLTAERDGPNVVVKVEDNGVGIAPDDISLAFELFTQLGRTKDRQGTGLGIGLYIVRRLVQMHGGTVEARSDGPGKGTRFTVRLPIPAGEPVSEPRRDAAPAVTGEPRRFLVVDDNVDSAESLELLLRAHGHETRIAHDGQEAVNVASEFRPEIILLDIGLPVMNGYEACRRIRAEAWGQDMLVVALTGWGQEDDRRKSREAGFDHHLVKPVAHDALLSLIASMSSKR